MTKEQKDKILKALAEDRNCFARDCNRRIAVETGKITGADYMLQRFLDILNTEVESEENCGDVISREMTIDALRNKAPDPEGVDDLIAIIKEIPSVTQKSETVTEFADRCRECGARYGKLLRK